MTEISILLTDLRRLPERAGVYFAISRTGEILYVGQSQNIRLRWVDHPLRFPLAEAECERIAFKLVDDSQERVALETTMINRHRPRFNRTYVRDLPMRETTASVELPDDLISPAEAAGLRGVSKQAVHELINRGRLKTYDLAGRRLVRRSDVETLTPAKPGPKAGTKKGKK